MALYKSRKLIKCCKFYSNINSQQRLSSQKFTIGFGTKVDTTI